MKRKLTNTVNQLLVAAFFSMLFFVATAQETRIKNTDLQKEKAKPYSGKADFKFVIVSNKTTLWSNDGSSIQGNEPKTPVGLNVNNGKYNAELGVPPMKPIFSGLLKKYPDIVLKTWVNKGNGFQQLPDKALTQNDISSLDEEKYPAISHQNEMTNNDQPFSAPPLIRNPEVIKTKIEKKKNTGSKAENPDERNKLRYLQRADKDGKIPISALLDAKDHIDEMWENQPKDAGIWNWEWLGPGNIGGRIRAIMIHPDDPDNIWIGGVSGGIWKTTNAGSSWQPVDDFLPSLNITSFAMDPNDYDVMYAATGEGFGNSWPDVPGAGIFKSTDGGDHWYQLPETNVDSFSWVTRLAHHTSNSGVLFATARVGNVGNWDGRVYKSTDGGDTWNTVLDTPFGATDIKLKPDNPNIIFVGTANGVWLSNTGGGLNSWIQQATGDPNKLPAGAGRCEIAVCPSFPNRVYVSIQRNGGEIWRSDNSGGTWNQRNTGTNYLMGASNQGWYDNTIWVNPFNSSFIVVGGIDLWRSTNGGDILTKISDWHDYHNGSSANSAHCDHHIIIVHPDFDNDGNKVVFFGNDGGIQKTDDISTVSENSGWVNLANNLGITQFYGGGASPDGSIIVGGTQDNSYLVYTSVAGNQGWYQDNTGDGGYAAVDYNNTNILYAEHQWLDFEKSTDGGNNWENARTGLADALNNSCAFIAPFSIDPNNPNILVAGGCSLWRTTDTANNWVSIRGPIGWACTAIDIANGNSSIIWAGYKNGEVVFTDNAGGNWFKVDNNGPNLLPNRWVTDIAINPNNSNEVIVTFAGYKANNVWRTTDAGNNWIQATGAAPYDLPALQVNTVRFHPANTNWIYIGTDLGVFASENIGATWSTTPRYENNEGPVNVEVAELFWAGDELIAATHGRGMYKSRPLINIYVNHNSPSGGNGSLANPYNNITDAVNAAGHGTDIYIFQGSYNEPPLLFHKRGVVKIVDGPVILE